MKKFTFPFFAVFTLLSFSAIGQRFFTDAGENKIQSTIGVRVIIPQKYRASSLDVQGIKNFLWSLPSEKNVNRSQAPIMELPMPDGKMAKFHVWESSIQAPGLEAKFPEIKTFAGQGIDDPYATMRMDFNPYFGFHAQILSVNGNTYIDPYARGDVNNYISYFTRDHKRDVPVICEVQENAGSPNRLLAGPCRGSQLYTYRLAVACTGEYAVAVGGTTAALLHAAIVTTVNRVDGVYESELSVRLVLIANNNLIEFLSPSTDPFNGNNNAGTLIGESQTVITANIGSANFDVGHTFSTGGGGVAGLGVVCNDANKARGITGLPNPVGDDYDIDFVAHEMGHQFSGNHPFNGGQGNCSGGNRNGATAYEPGSGTTIMAYAGICGTDDLQPHSDPFFHTISFDEISNFVEAGGASCRVATSTGNTLPVITAMNNNGANIPLNTPFTLTGSATDANGDAITYNWEEWDLGPQGAWNGGATSTTAPLFKSRAPKTTGSRTFPDMAVILAGYPANPPATMGGLKGETLPTVGRAMKFRLTVRDNRAGGGGVVTGGDGCAAGFTGIFQLNAITGTGPFTVSIPNGGENWPSGSSQTVTWNVAGTAVAPISAANVKISFSNDGGLTYPTVLTASTPNDGTELLTMPNVTTSTARIKIEAVGNVFFDISNANFSLGGAPGTDDAQISAIISPANSSTTACSPPVIPQVTIRNAGTTVLTTATINVRLNNAVVGTQAWTGSLPPGSTANVTLTTVPITPIVGSNTLKVHTTLPNGASDIVPANDTATSVFTRIASSPLPLSHSFEAAFLPPGWSVVNPDANATWGYSTPGAGGSARSTAFDNYNFNLVGETDDVRTTVINTSTGLLANDSVLITWDLAHKNFPGFNDKLEVLVSNNCGATFTVIWEKAGATLATAGSSTADYTSPGAGDWVKQRVAIGQNIFSSGQLQFAFRNTNDFGNWVWLDNINVDIKPRKDMQALTIVRPGATECAPPFAPSLTVRNNGGELVTGFKTGYILDGGAPVIQSHNIPLVTAATATVTFANITPAAGTHTIRMFVADPLTASVGPDGTPANDTITRTFLVPVTAVNIVQGFEGSTFAPASWSVLNPNSNVTWTRRSPGKSSVFSAFIDNYNNNTIGQLDGLQSPPVNTIGADSVIITFDVAHKNFPGSLDRLRVLVSTNCGVSYTSVYTKSGTVLATAGSSEDDFNNPAETEWRRDTISLNNAFTGGNILVQFENRNDYGNNIFIDNVNIAPKFKRDLEVVSVTPDIVCTPAYTPVATIRNRGTETVTAYKVSYSVGAGAPVTTTITGVTLASNATTTVPLTAGTLATGANIIKIYTWEPVTVSGTGDQYTINDTLTKTSYAASTVSPPLVETFEGTFIPSGWAISNPDGATTWQKSGVGLNSNGSAYMRNFGYLANGQKDGLFTPVFSFTGVDSIMLSFDLSAAIKVPDAGTIPLDTLEVLITKDCGNTFTSVYKKGGTQLQTIYDNTPVPTEYTPNAYYLWRKEKINLTSFAPNGPLQVIFRNTTNNQNNVFIDNVNFNTRTLPAKLKADGYIILPSPFADQFNIWFVQPPTDLRYVNVFNAAGQLIWKKTFGTGTSNVINVDLTGKSAGIYIVNLGYSDSNNDKQLRVLKSN